MNSRICPGCCVELDPYDGPIHRYMESSPACWEKYGELLAREFSDATYITAHQFTVDAYAVQHPGEPSPQSIQSVAVHLISLHAAIELHLADQQIIDLKKASADAGGFTWLTPPSQTGVINVLHALSAITAQQHSAAVTEWATAVWQSWAQHHEQVRAWATRHSIWKRGRK
jgi:hypothetical protein